MTGEPIFPQKPNNSETPEQLRKDLLTQILLVREPRYLKAIISNGKIDLPPERVIPIFREIIRQFGAFMQIRTRFAAYLHKNADAISGANQFRDLEVESRYRESEIELFEARMNEFYEEVKRRKVGVPHPQSLGIARNLLTEYVAAEEARIANFHLNTISDKELFAEWEFCFLSFEDTGAPAFVEIFDANIDTSLTPVQAVEKLDEVISSNTSKTGRLDGPIFFRSKENIRLLKTFVNEATTWEFLQRLMHIKSTLEAEEGLNLKAADNKLAQDMMSFLWDDNETGN